MSRLNNEEAIYRMIGASNHTKNERQEHDYYATDPIAMEKLLTHETFSPVVWECACGGGHLAEVMKDHGYRVIATDLIYRGYGLQHPFDFLKEDITNFNGDIITNPPYSEALNFVRKALETITQGHKVAMFLRVQFLEGLERNKFYKIHPPFRIYVFSKRVQCAKNGDFDSYGKSAVCYAWFIWKKDFKGEPIVKWL